MNHFFTHVLRYLLGKERRRKKPRVTRDVLDLCDERRQLKEIRYEADGAKQYGGANRRQCRKQRGTG